LHIDFDDEPFSFRSAHVAEWIRLTEAKGVSSQVATKLSSRGRKGPTTASSAPLLNDDRSNRRCKPLGPPYGGKATRAYAWSSPIEGSDKRRFFAVLHMGAIKSPTDAVRAAIVAEHRTRKKPRGANNG